MFKHHRFPDIKIMYKIFQRGDNTVNIIIVNMKPYIDQRCDIIFKNENTVSDAGVFTERILELRSEVERMIEGTFENNK